MIIFPSCKINIGLQVISRREDGYHNLVTIFYPLPLTDVLEVITSKENSFHSSGIHIPGEGRDNLCLKACHLLKEDFPDLPPVAVYLHKAIPIGAGLGGGSSDAAYMLRLLNEKYHLKLSREQLLKYAARLGSDCAFFLQDLPCYAMGRGDELYPFVLENMDEYYFVLVCPDIHIDTSWAYTKVTPKMPSASLMDMVRQPVNTWKDNVINDFECPVFDAYPQLARIKEKLYQQGALYASMSGSGAAMFGIFSRENKQLRDLLFENAKVFFF